MNMRILLVFALIAGIQGSPSANAAVTADKPVSIVPWPKSLQTTGGSLKLTGASRIVAADAKLAPLARILCDEIYMSTAVRLKVDTAAGGPGDIVLQLDPQLKGEQYSVSVSDNAVVSGGNYRAAAWGTVTLLQVIEAAGSGELRAAQMTVKDEPVASYRGVMIDLARQWHSARSLELLIEMSRLYKINYMHLHLNDKESFTLPLKSFPKLYTTVKDKRRTYTHEEIAGLVRYADERGVTLVPEIEGPGFHSGALRGAFPLSGTSCLDMGNEKTYEGMDVLIGEVSQIFASSPYIHIGADECDLAGVGRSESEKAFMATNGLNGARGLFNYYIVRMNNIIKKHGKKTICWEGFGGDGGSGAKIPKDVIVMPFESTYNPANSLVSRGYTVINTAWKPMYVCGARKWPAQYIYENWNMWLWEHHVNKKCHIQLKKTDPVLGAQMCSWENPASVELPNLRERIHAMGEQTWNPEAGRTYADFAARARSTDKLLDRQLGMMDVAVEGSLGEETHGYQLFLDHVTVRLSAPPLGTIHYTLDGESPSVKSPVYSGPIQIVKADTRFEKLFYSSRTKSYAATGNVVCLQARIFDKDGKEVGANGTACWFWHRAPEAEEKGKE